MGSSLGCFGNDNDGNNTICFSLVGISGVIVILLLTAAIVLCCVCCKNWRRRARAGRFTYKVTSDVLKYLFFSVQRRLHVGTMTSGRLGRPRESQRHSEIIYNNTYQPMESLMLYSTELPKQEEGEETERGDGPYQEMGTVDYEHMYSKAVPFS